MAMSALEPIHYQYTRLRCQPILWATLLSNQFRRPHHHVDRVRCALSTLCTSRECLPTPSDPTVFLHLLPMQMTLWYLQFNNIISLTFSGMPSDEGNCWASMLPCASCAGHWDKCWAIIVSCAGLYNLHAHVLTLLIQNP